MNIQREREADEVQAVLTVAPISVTEIEALEAAIDDVDWFPGDWTICTSRF